MSVPAGTAPKVVSLTFRFVSLSRCLGYRRPEVKGEVAFLPGVCRLFQVPSLSLSGPFASSKSLRWQLAHLAFPFKLEVLETALEKGSVTDMDAAPRHSLSLLLRPGGDSYPHVRHHSRVRAGRASQLLLHMSVPVNHMQYVCVVLIAWVGLCITR